MYPLPHPERIDGRGRGVIYAPETSNTTPGHREVCISKMACMALDRLPSTQKQTRNGNTGAEMQAQLP